MRCFVLLVALALWIAANAGAAQTATNRHRLDVPPALTAVRGQHPRLFLNAARVAELRQQVRTNETHRAMWEKLREQVNRAVTRGAPPYREQDAVSGDEQLWQREVGNAMPHLAMAWLISGERKYLDAAQQWALASCGYKTWGLGRGDGMDLATGHQLFGLAIVYDWCHDALDPAARATIRDTLVRRTTAMYQAAAMGKIFWHRSYLQNHLWVNITGMAAAGFALFDEVEDATQWIALPLDNYRQTMGALGHDGASHEGVGYWEYGVEYMMKFMDLARTYLDTDWFGLEWWRHTTSYGLYLSLPRHAWTGKNNIVDIGDSPRNHWYGPEYFLRGLAHFERDGVAQWLAKEIDQANVANSGASWLNLIWYDGSVAAVPPNNLPTLHHFDDMGLVSARTGWSGDESLVVFKCGPFLGHEAVQAFSYDPGGGHVHPDANHFVLFGAGEWLIRDDGYRAKWTAQHNTLLVDGKGQLGEGRMWFNGGEPLREKARPRILEATSTPELDRIAGDATEAYPHLLGLRRYVRRLIYLKPATLIVCDDIECDKPRALELRFFPESRKSNRDGAAFLLAGKQATLRLDTLTPEKVSISAGDIAAAGRHGDRTDKMFAITLGTTNASWRNAVALTWARGTEPPPHVTLEKSGDRWTFAVGPQKAVLDWAKQ